MSDERKPKQYVVAHVREAIAHDPHLSELNVDVSVQGGKVFLTGVVATPERRRALTEVVRAVAPEHEICNETEVAAFPETEGAEEIR
jgi:osmotically-inducible protein OsmY